MPLIQFCFNCKLDVVSLMLFCSNALSACVENTKVGRVCHTFYLVFLAWGLTICNYLCSFALIVLTEF